MIPSSASRDSPADVPGLGRRARVTTRQLHHASGHDPLFRGDERWEGGALHPEFIMHEPGHDNGKSRSLAELASLEPLQDHLAVQTVHVVRPAQLGSRREQGR
jgi:hypothetical protein